MRECAASDAGWKRSPGRAICAFGGGVRDMGLRRGGV